MSHNDDRASTPPPLPSFGFAEEIIGEAASKSLKDEPIGDERVQPGTPEVDSDATEEEETLEQYIAFIVESEEYMLPIGQVLEVIRISDITRVPNAKEHIRGVVNLRGEIIPVVDLRRRLLLEARDATGASRIVIVENSQSAMGLLVDSISHVYRIKVSDIEVPPDELVSEHHNCVSGVYAHDTGRLAFVMDLRSAISAVSEVT